MPRESKVSKQSVEKVVAFLKKEGKRPTVRAVRSVTGGSSVTVHRMLKEVLEERSPQNRPQGDCPECSALRQTIQAVVENQKLILEKLEFLCTRTGVEVDQYVINRKEKLQEAQKRRDAGHSVEVIAKALGMSSRWVQLYTRSPGSRRRAGDDEIAQAKEMRRNGASVAEISRQTGRSWTWADTNTREPPKGEGGGHADGS